MSREEDLLAAFIEFADTFVADYDVVEFLHRLATRCIELIDVSEAGIMLADGTARCATSHRRANGCALIELVRAATRSRPVPGRIPYRTSACTATRSTTRTRGGRASRPHARDLGFPVSVRAAHATPERSDRRPQPLLDHSRTAQPAKTNRSRRRWPTSLRSASSKNAPSATGMSSPPTSRRAPIACVVIEQAKGIVAEHNHVSVDDAFTLLRGYARNHNRLLRETADEIINGALTTHMLTGPSRAQPA